MNSKILFFWIRIQQQTRIRSESKVFALIGCHFFVEIIMGWRLRNYSEVVIFHYGRFLLRHIYFSKWRTSFSFLSSDFWRGRLRNQSIRLSKFVLSWLQQVLNIFRLVIQNPSWRMSFHRLGNFFRALFADKLMSFYALILTFFIFPMNIWLKWKLLLFGFVFLTKFRFFPVKFKFFHVKSLRYFLTFFSSVRFNRRFWFLLIQKFFLLFTHFLYFPLGLFTENIFWYTEVSQSSLRIELCLHPVIILVFVTAERLLLSQIDNSWWHRVFIYRQFERFSYLFSQVFWWT